MALLEQPQQQQTQQQAPQGSGFVNLQRILQANKSNQLGNTVGGGIQAAGQQAQGAITAAGNQFKTDYDKENARQSQESTDSSRILGNLGGNLNDTDVSTFNNIKSGQSQGPTGLQNTEDLRNQAQQATQLGQAVGSSSGRQGLLQRFVGNNGQYNAGQQSLDSVLLGQTGASQLRDARRGTLGLGVQETQAENTAAGQGQQLQSNAANIANTAITGLGNAVTGYDTQMQQAASKAAAQRQSDVSNALNGNLSVDQKTYDQLLKAGLDPKKDVYNTDLNQYIKANLDPANQYGVQSQSDFQKIQNASRLAGTSLTGNAASTLQNYLGQQGQVGTFANSDMFTNPDKIALANAINASGTKYAGVNATNNAAVAAPTQALGAQYNPGYSTYGQYAMLEHAQAISNPAYLSAQQKLRNGGTESTFTPEEKTAYAASQNMAGPTPTGGPAPDYTQGSNYLKQYYNSAPDSNLTSALDYAKNQNTDVNDPNKNYAFTNAGGGNLYQSILQNQQALAAAEAQRAKDNQFYRVGRLLNVAPTTPAASS